MRIVTLPFFHAWVLDKQRPVASKWRKLAQGTLRAAFWVIDGWEMVPWECLSVGSYIASARCLSPLCLNTQNRH